MLTQERAHNEEQRQALGILLQCGRIPTWANDEHTGYHVALWMEENGIWPAEVTIHSMSEAGRARIAEVCRRCGIRFWIEMARISR